MAEIIQGIANQSSLLNEKLEALIKGSDNQSSLLNEKLAALIQASENQSSLMNEKLEALVQGLDNQSKLLNEKLGSIHQVLTYGTGKLEKEIQRLERIAPGLTSIAELQAKSVTQREKAEVEHPGAPDYERMHLAVWSKNLGFFNDPRFRSAYGRGMSSGHAFKSAGGEPPDIGIEWQVYVCCWAALHAARLPGDFVECGVNTGMLSLAICEYIDFNRTGKSFWLFDTFRGIPEEQMNEREKALDRSNYNRWWYSDCWERTKANFAPFPKARLIRGTVPHSLTTVEIDRVCYLSIDMNIAYPERTAIEFFWPKLVPGAIVILDDYAWKGHEEQKRTLDDFAASHGVCILTLPTGQGILIK